MMVTTVWLGALGFADDYIKVFRKNKEGMHGKFKIVGQVGLGSSLSHGGNQIDQDDHSIYEE